MLSIVILHVLLLALARVASAATAKRMATCC